MRRQLTSRSQKNGRISVFGARAAKRVRTMKEIAQAIVLSEEVKNSTQAE
jgi:hypothetical protein